MTKSYFSAAELFDALDARVKPFGRVSMLSIEEKTKISRYLLTKLKKGIGERLTNQQVDALYAYAQSVGVKIPHDKIVKIVIVTESTQHGLTAKEKADVFGTIQASYLSELAVKPVFLTAEDERALARYSTVKLLHPPHATR